MKQIRRRSFVQIAVATSALAQGPNRKDRAAQQFFTVDSGASRPRKTIELSGSRVSVKVSGDDNGGEFALFEVPAAPGTGPALHVHHSQDEYFYVLEGEVDVQVGTEVRRLNPGASAYLPRMIPHTWQPAGNRDIRFLSLAVPAGELEAFLVDLSKLQRQGPLQPAAIKSLFERHDMEVVGPPLQSR